MRKALPAAAVIWGLAVVSAGGAAAEEAANAPEDLCRQAYLLEREGRKAAGEDDLPAAYEQLAGALAVYQEIARLAPGWRTEAIRGKIEILAREVDAIGRRVFSLPEGAVEVGPGMVREGSRSNEGRALAGSVKDLGGGRFEVEGRTVTVFRAGPLTGAACACPDFTYRGSRHGFACKHIWAVVFREKLLE